MADEAARWPLAGTRPKPWCFKNRASSSSGDRPESRSDNAEPWARSGRTLPWPTRPISACASVGLSGTKVADRQISSCGSVNSSGARADRKIAACVSVSLSETKAWERGLGTGGSVNVSGARVPERAIAAGGSVSLSGTRVPDRTLAGIKSISLSGTRSRHPAPQKSVLRRYAPSSWLSEMGFDGASVKTAMRISNGDVDRALRLLLEAQAHNSKEECVWEFEGDAGWEPFDRDTDAALEIAVRQGKSACTVWTEGREYFVDFDTCTQLDLSTSTLRHFRRRSRRSS